MNPAEVRWSRNHFDLLAINAVWGIPRSGLNFRKASTEELQLFSVVPWNDQIGEYVPPGYTFPVNAKNWRRYQQSDFEAISERFVAAGIKVTDPKGLLKD